MPEIIKNGDELVFRDQAEGFGGPLKNFAADACRIERPILLDPGDLGKANRVFCGYSTLLNGTLADGKEVRYISRVLPDWYEDSQHQKPNGDPFLWASAVQRCDGVAVYDTEDPHSSAPRGLRERAHVLYTNRTHPLLEDSHAAMRFKPARGQENPFGDSYPDEATLARFVTRKPKPISRVITVPRSILKWVIEADDEPLSGKGAGDPGPPVFEGTGVSEGGILFEYTWHEVPSKDVTVDKPLPEPCVGWKTWIRYINTVNKYEFDGFDPGTLMCMTPEGILGTSVNGEPVWTIIYRLLYLPKRDLQGNYRGHNAFLRSLKYKGELTLDYRYLTIDGKANGQRLLREEDFAFLFRPEQPGGA